MNSTADRRAEDTRLNELRAAMDDARRRYRANERNAPAAHNRAAAALDRANRALDRAETSGYAGSGLTGALQDLLAATEGDGLDFYSPRYRAYEQREQALRAEYNGYVADYNKIIQARRNRRAAAATHAAACNRCFTVHAGECI